MRQGEPMKKTNGNNQIKVKGFTSAVEAIAHNPVRRTAKGRWYDIKTQVLETTQKGQFYTVSGSSDAILKAHGKTIEKEKSSSKPAKMVARNIASSLLKKPQYFTRVDTKEGIAYKRI